MYTKDSKAVVYMSITVSIVIPVHNGQRDLAACLEAIARSSVAPLECLVVDDASTDDSVAVATRMGARVIPNEHRSGPASARNLGARCAQGDLVLFIDADVCVHTETISRVQSVFREDEDVAAVFGSYDDSSPADFFSKYKNLQHAFVHRSARREAATFWTGCGAVRREVFLALGGFDESFARPCIEDIEFGDRLVKAGHRVVVDGSIRVRHRKHYTFLAMLRSDLFDRAIPWTKLILRNSAFPNTLNVDASQRTAAAVVCLFVALLVPAIGMGGITSLLAWLALFYFALTACWIDARRQGGYSPLVAAVLLGGLAAMSRNWVLFAWIGSTPLIHSTGRPALLGTWALGGALAAGYHLVDEPLSLAAAGALLIAGILNRRFYGFLSNQHGFLFAAAAIPVHLFYYVYSVVGFAAGFFSHCLSPLKPRGDLAPLESILAPEAASKASSTAAGR
jgi:hypothetical protein